MAKKSVIVLFLFFIIMFGLNLLTPMMYGDDYVYAFVWPGQSMYIPLPETVERISSVNDLLRSQWSHYLTGNGRMLSHMLVQFFIWQGKNLFNIINSLVFVLLVLEIYWISNQGKITIRNLHSVTLSVIFFSLWAFTVNFGGVVLWVSGACNYLWMTTLLLSFILLYVRKYFQMNVTIIPHHLAKYLIFFWGIAAGWTNENTVCWIIVLLGLWLFKNRKEIGIESWMWYGLSGLCVGYLFLVFAPGNAVRLSSYAVESTKIWTWPYIRSKLITFGLIEFFEIFLWFFIITSWKKVKKLTKDAFVFRQLNLVKVLCLLNLFSNGIMFLSPEYPARSGFASLAFLTIATVSLIHMQPVLGIKLIDIYAKKFLSAVVVCYFIVTLAATYMGMYSIYQYDKTVVNLIQQHKATGIYDVLEISAPPNHSEFLLMASGWHLVRPELTDNENDWMNIAYARYYGISKIRVKK